MTTAKKSLSILLCATVLFLCVGCSPAETENTTLINEDATVGTTVIPTATEETTNKPTASKSLKILSVGNSLSRDGMNYLPRLLREVEYTDVVIAYLYVGGCSLEEHVEYYSSSKKAYDYYENTGNGWVCQKDKSLKYGLMAQDWDYVALQQASRLSGVSSSYKYLDELIDIVLKNTQRNPKLLWHMTWAYEKDCDLEFFERYDWNQQKMYDDTVSCIKEHILTNKHIQGVIPVGTAVQNARSTFIGDTVTEDGRHMSKPLGRYLAGLTWFGYLTGYDIDNIRFNPNSEKLDEKTVKAIKASVKDALKNPLG